MLAHLTVRVVNSVPVFGVICFGSSWTCRRRLVTLLCSLGAVVAVTTVITVTAVKPGAVATKSVDEGAVVADTEVATWVISTIIKVEVFVVKQSAILVTASAAATSAYDL